MASNGFRPALLFLSSSGVSTTASMWRESSPTARDDQWLRADRPSPTRLPSAYRHRKIPADPSSPLRINSPHQLRTGRENQLFFEVPLILNHNAGLVGVTQVRQSTTHSFSAGRTLIPVDSR